MQLKIINATIMENRKNMHMFGAKYYFSYTILLKFEFKLKKLYMLYSIQHAINSDKRFYWEFDLICLFFFSFFFTLFSAPSGFQIRLDFRNKFHIEPSPNCEYDYLEVSGLCLVGVGNACMLIY